MHDGNGQEVADGGHEQSAAWPGPVQHRVDVRLSADVGAVGQVVDDGECSVHHPEQDRVDKVQEAGRRRRQDEVEDDVDGIHGVEGKVYGADCFVTCTHTQKHTKLYVEEGFREKGGLTGRGSLSSCFTDGLLSAWVGR